VLRAAAASRGLDLMPVALVDDPASAAALFPTSLPVLTSVGDGPYRPGEPDEPGARLALHSLEQATALALSGAASGLVTAPVSKSAGACRLHLPGQTEFLAHACGIAEEDAVMMLAGPSLRTVPLTVHVPLSEVHGCSPPT
jgi:4-hydroxythreonine-4-phosphate dehydrogenase